MSYNEVMFLIEEERVKKRYGIRGFAEKIGISKESYEKYLRGECKPKADKLFRMFELLDLEVVKKGESR